MNDYIALFHTHYAALKTQRALSNAGLAARLAPVPRHLSASCGTCVKYRADSPCLERMDQDTECVVRMRDGGAEMLFENR